MSRGAARVLAAVSATTLALAAGEAAARVVFPSDPTHLASLQDDADTEERLTPDFTNVRERLGVRAHVDKAGFRDDEEVPLEEPRGEKRILWVGDSCVYAERLAASSTFWKRCESPGWRSIALCCPGWGTRQERAALAKWGVAALPDTVVLCFFVGNDVLETLPPARFVVGPDHAIRQQERPFTLRKGLLAASRLYQAWDAWTAAGPEKWSRKSTVAAAYYAVEGLRFEQWRNPRGTGGVGGPPAWERPPLKEAWAAVAVELEAFAGLARKAGARVLVLVIPDEIQVNPEERAELCRRSGLDERDYDLEQPQRAVKAIATRLGLEVVDVLPAMRGRTDLYFEKDTHWNERGHELAARLLAPRLEAARGDEPGH